MRYWIGVASSDHVARGVEGGFCQLCHGKAAPLRRMSAGDWIAYYSPRTAMKGGETVQAFTALGPASSTTGCSSPTWAGLRAVPPAHRF